MIVPEHTHPDVKAALADKMPIVQAMAQAESNFDPRAVSPKGAQGLLQIMPAMQKAYGVKDPFDPAQNAEAAQKILLDELARFGSLELAVAAYNAGSPRVFAACKKAGRLNYQAAARYLPKETRSYVVKVMKLANKAV